LLAIAPVMLAADVKMVSTALDFVGIEFEALSTVPKIAGTELKVLATERAG
jgi:hypothetical protein